MAQVGVKCYTHSLFDLVHPRLGILVSLVYIYKCEVDLWIRLVIRHRTISDPDLTQLMTGEKERYCAGLFFLGNFPLQYVTCSLVLA